MLCRPGEWNGRKPIGPHTIVTLEIMHCTAVVACGMSQQPDRILRRELHCL